MMTHVPRAVPDFVGRRLHELRRDLRELAERVRQAVVETVRDTLADLTRDTVDRMFHYRPRRPQYSARAQHHGQEYDPWRDDPDPDYRTERHWEDADEPDYSTPQSPARAPAAQSAVVLGLAVAGWWFRGGKWLGAVGAALLTGMAAAVTDRLPGEGRQLVQAVSDLFSLHRCLSTFGLGSAGD
jgi:hypothetical protein